MDFTIKSLKDAFDYKYISQNKSYKLYAMLLATSLDRDFIFDYLTYFHELHHLTGKEILVIGPQLIDPELIWNKSINNLWSSSLHYLHSDKYPEEKLEVQKKFLEFVNQMTEESYALANFLSIDKSKMPEMIFFEKLEHPENFIIWPIGSLTGKGFIVKFRKIIEQVKTELNWDIDNQIANLKDQLKQINNPDYYRKSYQYPMEIREEWLAFSEARENLSQSEIAFTFYSNLKIFVDSYNKFKDGNIKVPIVNIEKTIDKLLNGQVEKDYFDHLYSWARRWKTRLPKSMIDQIHHLYFPKKLVENDLMIVSQSEAIETYNNSLIQVDQADRAFKIKKDSVIDKIRDQIEVKNKIRQQKPRAVLEIISAITNISSVYKVVPSIDSEIRSLQLTSKPKKVFISYSHDNEIHKQKILELAQKLRIDGVDCWIDQFEENPEYGFTRWMQEQIFFADFVLIVCTPNYKMKFEAIENKQSSGGNFEGHLITQQLYDNGLRNVKFIPIIFEQTHDSDLIPLILRPYRRFNITREYIELLRHISGEKKVEPSAIGDACKRKS